MLRRAGAALFGQAGQAASNLLLSVVIARAAAPAVRGEFVLLTLLPQVGGYLLTAGLPAAILHFGSKDRSELRKLNTLALVSGFIAGALVTAVSPAVLTVTHYGAPEFVWLLLGNLGITYLITASWLGFGVGRFAAAGLIRAVPTVGAALVILAEGHLGTRPLDALYIPWSGAQGIAAAAVGGVLLVRVGHRRFRSTELRRWLGYGIRFSGNQVAQLLALRADQWLLGAIASTAAVGVYSVSASLSEGILLAATAVGVVVFADGSRGAARETFRRQLVVCVVTASVAALFLALLSHTLVTEVFGARYAAAVRPLDILLVGTPGLIGLRLVTNRLAGEGFPGTASRAALAAAALTIVLDCVLIPPFSIDGAAWASAIGYSAGGALALYDWVRRGVEPVAPVRSPVRAH